MGSFFSLGFYALFGVVAFAIFVGALSRYRRCPANKILVISGKVGGGKSARALQGGASFVWPLIQEHAYLSLAPISLDIQLRGALSKQNIRVDVPSQFTIGIATKDEEEVMYNAVERLLGMNEAQIKKAAEDITLGQLRATIATMDIEEINGDREHFEKSVMANVETELKKLGLKVINVNIEDIKDESGYLDSLGRRAGAEAKAKAEVDVAQQERQGAIGVSVAHREREVEVAKQNQQRDIGKANADQERRTAVAAAEATAVEGENKAEITKAVSEAGRREAVAESNRSAEVAERTKKAAAEKESYAAEQAAQEARATMEEARQRVEVVVPAEIARKKQIIEAEADRDQAVLAGEAKGKATQAQMEGEAAGMRAILSKQAEGFKELVAAAGDNPGLAVQFLIANKLEELMGIQVKAIEGIKIDKVVVWEGGANGNGKNATAGFLSGLMGSVPPLAEVMAMSGMDLPNWMAKRLENDAEAAREGTEKTEEATPEQ